jgi:PAS domain S-box-containing protein
MLVQFEQSGGMLALTFFEFVMVCVGLFYVILESNRQKQADYGTLTWGLAAYFGALIVEILQNQSLGSVPILYAPFWGVLSNALAAGGLLLLVHGLVTRRLLDRTHFQIVIKWVAVTISASFIIVGILSGLLTEFAQGGFLEGYFSAGRQHRVFAWEIVFAVQVTFLLVYASVTLATQATGKYLYAQGFIMFMAFGRLAYMASLITDITPGLESALPITIVSLVDPIGFLLLVMAINQVIAEDLQQVNLQLMRRTELLEDATRSLSKLNQLSINLLKTTHIPDITEAILAGLADEFGLPHAFLLFLDRETKVLKGIRLDSNGIAYHFMDIDMRQDHFLKDAMLKAKSLFFGDGSRNPDLDFIRNYNLSKNLVTVPLLTKKEKACYEIYDCDKVSCPVQAFGWNTCWLCKEECPFYSKEQVEDFTECVRCKAFNLVGLLVIDNRNLKKHRVNEKNLAFIETFANLAGMTLHNAMLLDDLSHEVTFRERTFKSLPSGVMVIDERGLIQSLNPSLLVILEIENKDVTGIPFEAVRLVNDEEHFHEIVNSVLSEGSSYEGIGESWALTLASRSLKLNIKVNPLPGTMNRHGAVILFEDITEVTELQNQLFQTEKLATLGQVAAGIAHEVNNPLAGVSGFLQVMASRLPEDSPERSAMQAALSNINRASGTIKDLLKFARLGPAQKRPIRLNEVLGESLVFVKFQREHENIEIVDNIRDDLPEVIIDPDQLRQVFTNLVLNALQAMDDEGTLTVSTISANGVVRTFIEDTGEGIPEENFELIFEPWFTTKQAKGTGLGLINCEKIIKDHGGTLAFSSVYGQGTIFIVDLPIGEDEEE